MSTGQPSLFTTAAREEVRSALVRAAEDDVDITGAALVGSAARGAEDRWSDVDLMLRLAEGVDEPHVVARWTDRVARRFGLADVHDVWAAGVRYRVLLLPSSLQVDLSFAPPDRFRSTGEPFSTLFGAAAPPETSVPPDVAAVVGAAWLHALHVRSALARGRPLQALTMLDGVFDRLIALLCAQRGLNPWHGRGADQLPRDTRDALLSSRPTATTADELARSFAAMLDLLLDAVERQDPARADALRGPIALLRRIGEA